MIAVVNLPAFRAAVTAATIASSARRSNPGNP
jgi:hypothetical protein